MEEICFVSTKVRIEKLFLHLASCLVLVAPSSSATQVNALTNEEALREVPAITDLSV